MLEMSGSAGVDPDLSADIPVSSLDFEKYVSERSMDDHKNDNMQPGLHVLSGQFERYILHVQHPSTKRKLCILLSVLD